MAFRFLARLTAVGAVLAAGGLRADDEYFEVAYPPATQVGALRLDVTYTVWIPDGAARLRGIIVHQHGCGLAANAAGGTAAYDLHWQALAAKWDCALLGPVYRQTEGGTENCRLWCDPRNGSHATFKRALHDLADKSGHAELETVPWCLWGHSGGAFWASLMQTLEPERVVAVWLRSGTAFPFWESGEIEKPSIGEATFRIPTMLNPGIKESTDGRSYAAWLGSSAMFKTYRAQDALIGFAADPRSGHECGDSRYLAIPYFDACLELRLPERESPEQRLRPIDVRDGWMAELMSDQAEPAAKFAGKKNVAVWLPNERVAQTWMEYVKHGATSDTSPPPAPTRVAASRLPNGTIEIVWRIRADLESGLQAFVIERDGLHLTQLPETPMGKYGRPSFQTMSYHDTPELPLPKLRYVDADAKSDSRHVYRVVAVNGVGLKSSATSAVVESQASATDLR